MGDALPSADVAIVGAGPIGIELAVALRDAGTSCVQFDAGAVGATIAWWAPETRFFSSPERIGIAGVPLSTPDQSKATREVYLAYLRGVVRQFDLKLRLYERVTRVERVADGFILSTRPSRHGVGGPAEAGEPARDPDPGAPALRAQHLVLAIGDMHRPRRLGIPGEDREHVSHFFAEPHVYLGRRVLIVGGKNSAVEAALRCYRCGVRVAMSYRGDAFDARRVKYWLRPEIEWLIDKGRVEWHPRTVPSRIDPESVRLVSVDGGSPVDVAADFVLLLTGYEQDQTLFEQLDLATRGPARTPVFDPETMETSVPGVYVAGTAAAGNQERARLYIENTHVHVERICRALTGRSPRWSVDRDYAALEES